MFTCSVCGRDYANRNSLTRHSHNHENTKQHVCLACGAVFVRKDLLSRHTKVHGFGDGRGSSLSPETAATRRQSYAACNHCRIAKVKCNGRNPCAVCSSTGRFCEYAPKPRQIGIYSDDFTEGTRRKRQRVSKNVRPSSGMAIEETPEETNSMMVTIAETESDSSHPMPLSTGFNRLKNPNFSSDINDHGSGTAHSLLSGEQIGNHVGNAMDQHWEDAISNSMTWPWVPEDIFHYPELNQMWPIPDVAQDYFFPTHAPALNALNFPPAHQISSNTQLGNQNDGHENVIMFNDQDINPSLETSQGAAVGGPADDVRTSTMPQLDIFERRRYISESRNAAQERIVEELVQYATNGEAMTECKKTRSTYWRSMSIRVSEVFAFDEDKSAEHIHILEAFVQSYLSHFNSLWPLLPKHDFDSDVLHPVLYLTLTSIGAMYRGAKHAQYGTRLHESIRKAVLVTADEIEHFDQESLWLGQSRLLTQVAALYFGTVESFSYAQVLGSTLATQVREMNLLSEETDQKWYIHEDSSGSGDFSLPPEERLSQWVRLEARKRLVFGILRAGAYASLILNTPPLLLSEEINLELPCSDTIWQSAWPSATTYLAAISDEKHKENLLFSDVFRITVDRREESPQLGSTCRELLLFGLQHSVWRFSHDPGMFHRLTQSNATTSRIEGLKNSTQAQRSASYALTSTTASSDSRNTATDLLEVDILSVGVRRPDRDMDDLYLDRDRLFLTLRKWKTSFDVDRTSVHLKDSRNSILSSLLLYHLSHLKLQAPIHQLHAISRQLARKGSPPKKTIDQLCQWTQTSSAKVAVQHASDLWSIVHQESQRPATTRAQINFLAVAALYHAAVVMWAYAGTHDEMYISDESAFLVIDSTTDDDGRISICCQNVQKVLDCFIQLYRSLSASKWSSYVTAAVTLKRIQFPVMCTPSMQMS